MNYEKGALKHSTIVWENINYHIQQNEYYIWTLKRKQKNYSQIKLQRVRASRGTLSSYLSNS